ncbi:hypothetical protein BJV74DRAFT_258290 [Russula compacta]|nr:hypothetical protein BJV74DRAFT_258290 [Russula compacta]
MGLPHVCARHCTAPSRVCLMACAQHHLAHPIDLPYVRTRHHTAPSWVCLVPRAQHHPTCPHRPASHVCATSHGTLAGLHHGALATPPGAPPLACLACVRGFEWHPCGFASRCARDTTQHTFEGLLSTFRAQDGSKMASPSLVTISSGGQSALRLILTMHGSCALLPCVSVTSTPPGAQDPQVQDVCHPLARFGIMHLDVGLPGMIPRGYLAHMCAPLRPRSTLRCCRCACACPRAHLHRPTLLCVCDLPSHLAVLSLYTE